LGAARVIGVSLTVFVLPYLCFAYGEQHVSAAQVSVLVSLGPIVSALVAHLATADERIGILDVGRLAVGLACVGWAAGIDVHAPIAWAAALSIVLALASYAVGGVCIRMWSSRATPLEMATAALVVASVVSVVGAVRTLDVDKMLQAPLEAHLSVLWLGVGPTATAFALRFRQTAALGVRYVAFAGWLMPLFGLGLAALFSGDTLEWPMVFGVVLVLALVVGPSIHNALSPQTNNTSPADPASGGPGKAPRV